MIAIAILAGSASLPGLALDPRAEIALTGPSILVGDVVPLANEQISQIEIARLPTGRSSITLSRLTITALIRRAAPGVRVFDKSKSAVTFRRIYQAGHLASCFVIDAPVAAGAVVDLRGVRKGSCGGGSAPVRYDPRSGATIAMRLLAAGDSIGTALPRSAPGISQGAEMTLVTVVGPIFVERRVTALQSAQVGGRVFLRDAGGKIFSAPVAGAAE